MKEIGLLNREISDIVTRLGHGDEICICDAGFAIPDEIRNIDISLKDDYPGLIEVLVEILKNFSVEKAIIAEETKKHNPKMFKELIGLFEKEMEVEAIPHTKLKKRSKRVKGIIRTGEFTPYSNIILISGVKSNRWKVKAL